MQEGSEHQRCKLAFTQTLRKYMSFSFDLFRSFIVLGDLCPSLGDLYARLGAPPLQTRLYTDAQEVYIIFI